MSHRRLKVLCALLVVVSIVFFRVQATRQAENRQRQAEKRRHQQVFIQAWTLVDALYGYEDAHDMTLPPATNWEEALRPYITDKHFSFQIPAASDGKPRRWVFERTVAGHKLADLRPPYWERAVFFEAPATQSSTTDTLARVSQMAEEEELVIVNAMNAPVSISSLQRSRFLLQNQKPLMEP